VRIKKRNVIPMLAIIVAQNPSRGSNIGKKANMGKVGMTYQNVYHAWLDIFSKD